MNNYSEGKVCTAEPVRETVQDICGGIYNNVRESLLMAQRIKQSLFGDGANEQELKAECFMGAMANTREYAKILCVTLAEIMERFGI